MKNKNTLKILDKTIELAKLLIELQNSKNVPIPDYKKRSKDGGLAIVGNGNGKGIETIVTPDGNVVTPLKKDNFFILYSKGIKTQISPIFSDGKNTPLSNFQKLWDEKKPDFLKEIIKKEKESDFHKGMLDADNELNRVCKEQEHKNRIDHFYELRSIFGTYTIDEIKKDPVLIMKAKLVLIEAIQQIDLL